MTRYLLLALAAALSFTTGGICMKLSDGLTRPLPSVLLYVLFAVGATCNALILRRADLGVAYLLVLGLESILAFVFGVLFFGEDRAPVKLAGVALIAAGILLLHAPKR